MCRSAVAHCRARRDKPLLIAPSASLELRYDEAADVLIRDEFQTCWWRAEGGSPKDCTAYWRGTATVSDDAATAEADAAGSVADAGAEATDTGE